jgi:hypothetical protein
VDLGTSPSVKVAAVALLVLLGLGIAGPAPAPAQTFEGTVNVSNTAGDSKHPHLVLDDAGTLHVVWADDTGQPGHHQVVYARSFDQGRTFTPPTTLSAGAGAALRPRLAVRGPAVYVVWMEDVSATKDIMFVRSIDGGNGFEPPRNLSNSDGQSQEARVAVNAAGVVFVVWDEETPSRHLALARSTDGGASFGQQVVVPIVRDPAEPCPADASPSSCTAYPGIAVDPRRPNNVYVSWHDKVAGKLDVYFTRSTDSGGTFEAARNVSNAEIHAHCAAMTVGPSGKVLISYESRKQPPPLQHKHNSVLIQSLDGGQTFTAPVDVSDSPTDALSDYPWPAEGPDGTIAVGYEDNAVGGELDAVVRVSRNGGSAFGGRVDISQNPAGTSTEVVTLFGPDGTLYVIWEDHGDGPGEGPPGEILIARAPGTATTGTPPLQLSLQVNQTSFGLGETARLSVTAANPGPAGIVDVYVGLLTARQGIGCPAGDTTIVLLVAGFTSSVTDCGSTVLRDIAPVYAGVAVPANLPLMTAPLGGFVWRSDLPAGVYTFFIAVTPPGALGDGNLGPTDLVAVGTATVTYTR